MSEQFEFDSSAGALQPRDHIYTPAAGGPGQANGSANTERNGHVRSPAFGVWTVLDILASRWHWLVIGGILGSAAFFVLGLYVIKPKFTALAQLLRYETHSASEDVTGPAVTPETFAALLRAPELMRRVSDELEPSIPPDRLVKHIKVDPQPDSQEVRVFAAATTPQQAVDIANLFTTQAVAYTRELQARQAEKLAKDYLRKQVEMMDRDISDLEARFRAVPGSGNVTSRLAQVSGHIDALNQTLAVEQSPLMTARMVQQLDEALIKLQGELRELNARYTELHPDVQRKMAEIEAVQSQRKSYSTNLAALSATGVSTLAMGADGRAIDPMVEIIGAKLNSLEYVRIDMLNRQREAELYAQDPPGMARIHAPATLKTVSPNHRELKIGIVSVFGGFLGMLCALGLVLLTEAVDSRLKSADDLKRVARLPVLSTLGDLNEMHEEAQTQWAFRTWTMLQGRLSRSQNHGLVCGITSSTEGEGRSTWISLLAEAASLSGFRVLTIATQPSATPADSSEQLAEGSVDPPETMNAVENNHALTSNVLAFPARVTEQLTGPNSQPVVHIPMPGWVWNLERRKQWRAALNHWCKIDNLVIFVELPPACIPEAVLLGSNLPNLLWLADSGTADAEETRIQLQTLRDARCNLVGAVLNREQGRSLRSRFPRWIGCAALVLALGAAGGRAQETAPLPIEPPPGEPAAPLAATADARTNRFFSITGPEQRADWQKHLTLGAGDILTFALYGEPLLTRTEVVIAPDGRVSYLEAQDVMAAGLTVDELRERIDQELSKYRKAARTMITPVAYRSKKYYVLGKVVQRGAYVLDQPITVIEALARAKGLETGILENNTVDLADLSRSFLMRDGKKMPIDFERLFQQGDLSQNVQIEPGDYLYFPSADVQQVYVLGEVSLPGPVTHRPDSSVLTVISARGGFNQKAFRSRVLVVRGSLNQPEAFIVDTMAVTAGRLPDFKLQPRDIVYVSHRPFYRVEDLLDLATTAFIQAVVTSWVGEDIVEP